MSEIEENKELKDSLLKCRCCLRILIDDRRAVEIDDQIREQFFSLCQISLLKLDILAERICQLCACDLQTFSSLRADLIEKQKTLYALTGLDITSDEEALAIIVEEEIPAGSQDSKEEKVHYEIIEEECEEEYETMNLWEEYTAEDEDEAQDDNDTTSSYFINEDDDESTNVESSVLKIEKIGKTNGKRKRCRDDMESNTFDVEVYENPAPSGEDTIDEEQIECNLCGIEILQSYFDYHVELMHVEDTKCEKCEKVFQSKILLKKHKVENHNYVDSKAGQKIKRKIHFCGLCDKEYEYKKYLDDHVRSFHRKERNRQCPICLRCFYHRDIKKHIDHVHGEKRISCKICGKMYTCLENLKLHMRYHEDPKYSCNVGCCNKKFHQKILWEHHMLKHSTEKPIECNECGNFFYTVRDLKRHSLRVHTKVLRKCFGCETTFNRKDKYREHVIKHHSELTDEERSNMLDNIRALKWNEA